MPASSPLNVTCSVTEGISYPAQNEILYVVQRQFESLVRMTSLISISADNFVRGDEFSRNHGAKNKDFEMPRELIEYPSNVKVKYISARPLFLRKRPRR
jgi:hypothetical protein